MRPDFLLGLMFGKMNRDDETNYGPAIAVLVMVGIMALMIVWAVFFSHAPIASPEVQ